AGRRLGQDGARADGSYLEQGEGQGEQRIPVDLLLEGRIFFPVGIVVPGEIERGIVLAERNRNLFLRGAKGGLLFLEIAPLRQRPLEQRIRVSGHGRLDQIVLERDGQRTAQQKGHLGAGKLEGLEASIEL